MASGPDPASSRGASGRQQIQLLLPLEALDDHAAKLGGDLAPQPGIAEEVHERIGKVSLAKMPVGVWRYLPVGERF